MKLSVIIPAFNEAATIGEVLRRVRAVEVGMEKEIIVVDDGSTDQTRERLAACRAEATGVELHFHSEVNLGKGAAVRIGLAKATGDIVLVQDADLELDPAAYPGLLAPILRGEADVVYGVRDYWAVPDSHWTTRVANFGLSALTTLLYQRHVSDMETAYKVMRRDLAQSLRLRSVGFDFEPEVTAKILRLGHRIYEVPVTYRPRSVRDGKKIRWTDGVRAVGMLVACRVAPMESVLAAPRGKRP